MNKKIIAYLQKYKKTKIPLNEIEKLFSGETRYEDFANEILKLENQGILVEVKTHKRNNKPISLANTYSINKHFLKEKLIDAIKKLSFYSHHEIKLNSYLALTEKVWKNDLLYIKKIDQYLKKNGFPNNEATSQQRSYEILGDEKWIDEKGGKTILERIDFMFFIF